MRLVQCDRCGELIAPEAGIATVEVKLFTNAKSTVDRDDYDDCDEFELCRSCREGLLGWAKVLDSPVPGWRHIPGWRVVGGVELPVWTDIDGVAAMAGISLGAAASLVQAEGFPKAQESIAGHHWNEAEVEAWLGSVTKGEGKPPEAEQADRTKGC